MLRGSSLEIKKHVRAKGVQIDGLYIKLQVDQLKNGALVHISDTLCEIWHRNFGHLHHEALPLLKNMV